MRAVAGFPKRQVKNIHHLAMPAATLPGDGAAKPAKIIFPR
jgi:hypothetical protein